MKILAIVFILLASAMTWQHLRYLSERRTNVQDLQPILYSSSSFHVATFVEFPEGADLVKAVGELRRQIESAGSGRLVYAGQVAFAMQSKQIEEGAWDAVILMQYPTRQDYEQSANSAGHRGALAALPRAYSHGMIRNPIANLLIPQGLLAVRLVSALRGHWTPDPLTPMPPSESEDPERSALIEARRADLLRLRPINDDALVVFNLIKNGSAEQQSADRSYGMKMIARMAAGAHGPMHMGSAVTVEGDAVFDTVAIVYYPGVSYFAKLIGSRFFQGIIGDKQLGDTLSVPTVPILSLL